MRIFVFKVFIAMTLTSCAHNTKSDSDITILPVSKAKWEKLNPARGNKSPQAGTLWGHRGKKTPTAFLAKFADGFSSPPHIHNVSYRAIVIQGLVHNDDSKAAKMWMPKGSYWTQPAGAPHITASNGGQSIALVEINEGPYLVKPVADKFDNGERPYNIHSSNVLWRKEKSSHVADLWQDSSGQITGSLLKFSSEIKMSSDKTKVVVIKGEALFKNTQLKPGSLIASDQPAHMRIKCITEVCIVYVKTTGEHLRVY